jgi:surface protein
MSKKSSITQKHKKTNRITPQSQKKSLIRGKTRKNIKKGGNRFTPNDAELRTAIKELSNGKFGGPPIHTWDTSKVKNMDNLFEGFSDFNEDISKWDVSNVTSMKSMFARCDEFNQPLNNWDVSNVTSMESMFDECFEFNQPLNKWNVSNVTSMKSMFARCDEFNQPLNNWDVSKVTSMAYMFAVCEEFNQPLNKWNVKNVNTMEEMFIDCTNFNQSLNEWDVSKVTSMAYMFSACIEFNQPLNKWGRIIFGKDIDMNSMFEYCINFNQDISAWVVDQSELDGMFENCGIEEGNKPIPIPIVSGPYFPNIIPSVSLNDRVVSLDDIQQQTAYDPIEGDVEIGSTMKEDKDKIIFKFQNSFYAITKQQIKSIYDNHNETIYGCYKPETSIIPRAENVDKKEPYFYLNKIGIISGIVQYGYIKHILETETTRYYEIVPTKKEWTATTTGEMLGTTPQAVSAHHCQKGTSKKIYEIERLIEG